MSRNTSQEEALFADALARPQAERGEFLAKACGANVDLLAHLVALVAAHNGPDSLLAAGPIQPITKLDEKPGDAIGRYKLLQKIGEGGCGLVWMAEQEEPVRRRVALKVIKLGMDTKAVVARFEAERQALAMMDHPNIAKVHDAGATETGRPFFVMELVRGIPITKYCDENHLTPKERLELFIKVCQAIQHAHQKGVIHRDIKPSNILVTVNDGAPMPKVIDFGIAKATQGKLTDATVFTAFEQFIGTPVYMSPEQAEMSSLDIDTRSDIYSLGVLLYELLTGRPPFDPKAFAQAGVDQIRQQIREREPAKPSRRLGTMEDVERTTIANLRNTAPAQLSILLRGDLDWIVMRCLEKDRTRRYDTANGLAMDIQRHLRNEPVTARPPSSAYLLQKLIRRNRVAFAGGAAVAIVFVVGGIASTWLAVRATQAEREQTRLRVSAQAAERQQAELRARAEAGEADALSAAAALRQTAYVAEMNLAQQAVVDGNMASARVLLEKHRPRPGEKDIRGFEWRHLWAQTRGDDTAILGQYIGRSAGFAGVAISPDGSLLATSAAPHIEVRSFPEGVLINVLRDIGSTGNVGVLKFSPDGRLLFSVGAGAKPGLKAWNTLSWKLEVSLEVPETPFAFARSGRVIVARNGNRLSLWSADSWAKLDDLPGEITETKSPWFMQQQSIAASADGNTVYYGDANLGIRSWDLRQMVELHPMKPPFLGVATCLAASPQGIIAASHYNGRVTLWSSSTGELLQTFEAHRGWASCVAFSPDGSLLASVGSDQTIILFSPAEKKVMRRFTGHEGEIWALAFSADGAQLVTGSAFDGTIRQWALATPPRGTKEVAAVQPLAFVDSTRGLVCWSHDDGFIRLDLNTGRQTPSGHQRIPGSFARHADQTRVSPDLSTLAQITTGGVEIWNLHSGRLETVLKSAGSISSMAFSHDGSILCTAGKGAPVSLWNTQSWSARELSGTLTEETGSISFSNNGNFLAVKSGWELLLFDLSSHGPPIALPHKAGSQGLAFSPDGSMLAAGTVDSLIRLWEINQRKQIAELRGHLADVTSLVFSPDGRTFASSGDNVVKLWNVETKQEIFTFPSLGSEATGAMFSPDGNFLAVGSHEERVHVWRAPSLAEIERAERATGTAVPAP